MSVLLLIEAAYHKELELVKSGHDRQAMKKLHCGFFRIRK